MCKFVYFKRFMTTIYEIHYEFAIHVIMTFDATCMPSIKYQRRLFRRSVGASR